MPTVFITGVNRGLGLEFVKQYSAAGWHVIGTCRDLSSATEASALADTSGKVELYPLEVTDEAAVKALASDLSGRTIDILILNAGVLGDNCSTLGKLSQEDFLQVMNINSVTPAIMIQAFQDHVAASERKIIVCMSSILGSIAGNTDGGLYSYRASKAALNGVMRSAATDLRPRGITCMSMHPGWVITDMGGKDAMITTEVSIAGMMKVIAGLSPADAGRFLAYDGEELPW